MLPTAPKKSQFTDEIGARYGEIQYRGGGKVLQRYRVSGGNVRLSMALSCIYSEIKRDWSKIVIFSYPLHSTTPLIGGSQSEYCHPVWCGKTRIVELPDSEKCLGYV